jgi:HlyD family secretion protein
MIRSIVLLTSLAGVVGGGVAWYLHETADQPSTFRTITVERGNLLATINATAVVEPEELVDVGAQIAGMVQAFGKDLDHPTKDIDYDSRVEIGTVLAQIDVSLYKATLHQAKANLDNAVAMLEQAKTNLKLSQENWQRAVTLHERKVMSQADYDSAQADLETKTPALDAAQAAVEVAKANLETAQTNVNYCTITSPVKGVIVDRRVNIGQTVVSSLSAPSLFLIARDLKRMQVWASVNEADMGQIHEGQMARFTVDAFPGVTFHGVVSQIRLNANMTQNVVTYTVVVTTDNSDGKLLPYMTANVKFEIAERKKVLVVPTAALRWKPQPNQVVADARGAFAKSSRRRPEGQTSESAEAPPSGEKAAAEKTPADSGATTDADKSAPADKGAATKDGHHGTGKKGGGHNHAKRDGGSGSGASDSALHDSRRRSRRDVPTVWVDEDGFARPVEIETGVTDGTMVEVVGGKLEEGAQVIVGEVRREETKETKNPFIPSMFRGGNRSKEKDK